MTKEIDKQIDDKEKKLRKQIEKQVENKKYQEKSLVKWCVKAKKTAESKSCCRFLLFVALCLCNNLSVYACISVCCQPHLDL